MSEENLILLIFYLATLGATIYLFTKSFNAYSERDKSAQSPKGDYETSDWHYTYTYVPKPDVKAKLIGKMEDEELDKDVAIKEHNVDNDLKKAGIRLDEGKSEVGEPDMVNHPPHYNSGKFETIDVIEDALNGYEGFAFVAHCLGTTIKYIYRGPFKGKMLEDLKKARFYLDKAIKWLEKKEKKENEVRQGNS